MRTKTFGHRDDDMVITDSQRAILAHLDRNVAIADMPRHTRGFYQTMTAQVGDRLVGGVHPNKTALLQLEAVPMREPRGIGQIELNRPVVIGP